MTITWDDASARAGRNAMPSLVWALRSVLHIDELRKGVCEAWSMAEWPQEHLGSDRWTRLFLRCGFMIDGIAAHRDALPKTLTLYRGAIHEYRTGMSWTGDMEQARWFARRFDGMSDENAGLYRVEVEREHVLAHLAGGRKEDEYVLHPERLGRVETVLYPRVPPANR